VSRRNVLGAAAVIVASARQSAEIIDRLTAAIEPLAIEQYADDLNQLSTDYMFSPPAAMAQDAKQLRDRIIVSLERTHRPEQIADLYRLAGQASGILAYAALDLGNAKAAMANARSALACADAAGHNSLAIWARGTQSLVARFAGRPREAERYLDAGMALNPRGAGLARLAASRAQCRAHLGDVDGTRRALAEAAEAHHAAGGAAGGIGLFGFARSKVHFYAASSLIYLPGGVGARVAAEEALVAIKLFQAAPADERFITDEILAHIYGANAYIQQGHIDAARQLMSPVFATPKDQRVSWHRQRLSVLDAALSQPALRNSRDASDLRSRLADF
jgi:hypothetical protein